MFFCFFLVGRRRIQQQDIKVGLMYCRVNRCGKEVKKGVQAGWNGWRKVLGVMCGIKKECEQKGVEAVVREGRHCLETVTGGRAAGSRD